MDEKRTLIVIDMQNDFVYGPLGTDEARAIVPNVKKKIEEYRERGDMVMFTMDNHHPEFYLDSHEGRRLPVKHCGIGSDGWHLIDELSNIIPFEQSKRILKASFGFDKWGYVNPKGPIEIVGVCTNICVVSNALILRAMYPERDITVDASCCAGTTPEMHKAALAVMKSCHIDIINQ